MNKHLIKLLAAGALLIGVAACSQNQSADKPTGNDVDTLAIADSADSLATGRVHAIITDAGGKPLDSVRVLTTGIELITNKKGEFKIDTCPTINGRVVVRLQKEGYFDRIYSKEYIDTASTYIIMVKKEVSDICQLSTFHSSKGTKIKVQKAIVEIPADALVYMSDSSDYTGNVNISVIYYNPDAPNFNLLFPGGDLMAINNEGERGKLISYGMLDVEMKSDKGELLQLKKGKQSKLTFPKPNCQAEKPAKIPLWWFNEKTGFWVEEGVSELKGNNYEGYVSHFTPWNCDNFLMQRYYFLEIQFVDKNNNPVEASIPFTFKKNSVETSYSSNQKGYFADLTLGGNTIVVGGKSHSLPVLKASGSLIGLFENKKLVPNRFVIPLDCKINTVYVKTILRLI